MLHRCASRGILGYPLLNNHRIRPNADLRNCVEDGSCQTGVRALREVLRWEEALHSKD